MRQSISRFSNLVTKYYFRCTLIIPSAYFLPTVSVLLLLCSQKYRSENILPIQYTALFYHLSSFLFTRRFSFFRVHSIRRSPFLLSFIFFRVLVLIILSYKVWCKYACPFISNTVKIRLQRGKSMVNIWLQVG